MNFFKISKGGKFAVECDWIKKISQKVQNLGFSLKNRWVFRKLFRMFWIYLKVATLLEIAYRLIKITKFFQSFQEVFWQKHQKSLNVWKIKKYVEKASFFEEKTFSTFNITFYKMRKPKKSRWSCFAFESQTLTYKMLHSVHKLYDKNNALSNFLIEAAQGTLEKNFTTTLEAILMSPLSESSDITQKYYGDWKILSPKHTGSTLNHLKIGFHWFQNFPLIWCIYCVRHSWKYPAFFLSFCRVRFQNFQLPTSIFC